MMKPFGRIRDWRSVLFNISFALNCMLLFFLLFESRLSLPGWVQVIGRMHPLLLHFPLVLIILYALMVVFLPRDEVYKKISASLLAITAFTAVLTAMMGLFLSKEPGYDHDALLWHKWGGVGVSVLSLILCVVPVKKLMAIPVLLLIVITGHLGAGITHGEGFLLAPVTSVDKAIAFEDAKVYQDMVRPIFEQKCMQCHNHKKAKGELVMETEALLLKGGKDGKLWDTAAADLGLLLRRLHLPLEQKEHMPPKEKPQLTDEEAQIIEQWIKKGADFNLRVADLSHTDTLYQIAFKNFNAEITYNFPAPDAATVSKLNSVNRVVGFESTGSPALVVNFFNSNLFKAEQLNELLPVKQQIVSLDLAKMPLQNADMKLIGEFENLRHLNLSFTGISSLADLKQLKNLQTLSISGTNVHADQLKLLPAIKTLYAWNTPAAKEDLQSFKFNIETGFKGDTVILKLPAPVSLNEKKIIGDTPIVLKLKNYIQGAVIHFTSDGTEPDSIHAAVFKGNETINSNTTIKAKAYKPGWLTSDVMEISFLKSGFTPDSVMYLTKPNERYSDEQGKLLIDHAKGEANFRAGGWVAFRENNMQCILPFFATTTVQSIGLSCLVDVGSYIMPPESIEVWGGNDLQHLKLLGKVKPPQPAKVIPSFNKYFECSFKPASVKYIKLIANPVAKLPAWHPGKGDKAWIFLDEILIN